MGSEYILEFRSIDPARRYCESSYKKRKFIQGFNQNELNNADEGIKESVNGLKKGFGDKQKLSFLIKPYQRGFRWDAHDNVRKLLDDLFSYSESKKNSDLFNMTRINYLEEFNDDEFDFYCLQTLTLKSDEGDWEVIDGQQRLTCIFLIYMVLSFFCGCVNTPYEIRYQREGEDFLFSEIVYGYFNNLPKWEGDILQNSNLTESEKKAKFEGLKTAVKELFAGKKDVPEKNVPGSYIIDSYYVRSAIIEIIDFVSEGKEYKQIKTLLECIKRNVYFLWYEVPADPELSSENVFQKINSGAIPLTNAELIKSLILRKSGDDSRDSYCNNNNRNNNSRKWEALERGLREDELWSFVSGNYNLDTRIELLLDVYARKNSNEQNAYSGVTSNNPYALFDWYNAYSKSSESFAANVLDGIQDCYDRIVEWYDDVEIYHFVGLLTVYQRLGLRFDDKGYKNQQEMLKLLLLEAENENERVSSKDKFIQGLKTKVLSCLKYGLKEDQSPKKAFYLVECPDSDNNDYLNYNDDSKRIEAILWLFNVWETIESADNKIEYEVGQFKYKNNICRRFPFTEALSGNWSLEHIFPQRPDDTDPKNLEEYKKFKKEIEDKKINENILLQEEDVHSVKNLALLKKNTNTKLQNMKLNMKRSILISESCKGVFIPCATVKAFMLYYNIVDSKKDTGPKDFQIGDDWDYWTANDADNYEKAIVECLKKMEGETK